MNLNWMELHFKFHVIIVFAEEFHKNRKNISQNLLPFLSEELAVQIYVNLFVTPRTS